MEEGWIKGYKCTNRLFDDIVSFSNRGRQCVYGIDEVTQRPEGQGPLAVFATLEDAIEFAGATEERIYECESLPSLDNRLWLNCLYPVAGNFEEVYYYNIDVITLPKGTMFADKVKLTRLVTRKEMYANLRENEKDMVY